MDSPPPAHPFQTAPKPQPQDAAEAAAPHAPAAATSEEEGREKEKEGKEGAAMTMGVMPQWHHHRRVRVCVGVLCV